MAEHASTRNNVLHTFFLSSSSFKYSHVTMKVLLVTTEKRRASSLSVKGTTFKDDKKIGA